MKRVEPADVLSECFKNYGLELKAVVVEAFALFSGAILRGFHQCIWLALIKTT